MSAKKIDILWRKFFIQEDEKFPLWLEYPVRIEKQGKFTLNTFPASKSSLVFT